MERYIFVTVGSGKIPFNRLIEKVDIAIERGTMPFPVFAQTGAATYQPKHFLYTPYLPKEQFDEKVRNCEVLVTHGGVGSIMSAIYEGKPVVVCPRLGTMGENVDDHQIEIAETFVRENLVMICRDEDDLGEIVERSRNHKFEQYKSGNQYAVQLINRFLQREC